MGTIFRLLGLLSFLTLSACTRLSSDTVAVSLPQSKPVRFAGVGKQAADPNGQLYHAIVNITGPGIPGVMSGHWSRHEQTDENAENNKIEIPNVPNGEGRLIQVLALYREGSSMAFYYSEKDSPTGSGEIVVDVQKIANGNIVSAQVSGRYLTGTNAGPTGEVQIKYYPTNGLPLLVEKSFMVNGWFSFFMLDGAVKFGYELSDGTLLWGKPVNLSEAEFDPGTRVVRAAIPVHLRQNGDPMNPTWQYEEPAAVAIGWFGDPAHFTTKQVCRPTSAPSMSRLSVWAGSIGVSPPQMPGAIVTGGSIAFPTIPELVAEPNFVGGYRVTGGNTSGCSDPLEHMDVAELPAWMNGNGKDGMSYVFPPLTPQGSAGTTGNSRSPFNLTMGSTGASLTGQMLPGVGPAIFDRIEIFKRPNSANWEWRNDGSPCPTPALHGFQSTGTMATIGAGGSIALNIPLTTTEGSAGVAVALCFRGPSGIQNAGFVLNSYNFSNNYGGGGGGGSPPYLRLQVDSAHPPGGGNGNFILTQNYCHTAYFTQNQGFGAPYVSGTTAVSITNLPTTGDVRFYGDSACSGVASSTSIAGGQTQSGTLYVRATTGTMNYQLPTLTITDSPATFDPMGNRLDVGLPKLQLDGPTRPIAGMCYSFSAMSLMANGSMLPQTSLGFSLDFQGTTQAYSISSDCNNTINSFAPTITGGMHSTGFWGKTTAAPGGGTFHISSAGFVPHGYPVTIGGTTGAAQGRYLRFEPLQPPVFVSKCNAIRVSLVNGNEMEVPADVQVPLKLHVSNRVGSFFSDPGCTMLNDGLSIMPGQSGITVWYQPYSATPPEVAGLPGGFPIPSGGSIMVSTPGGGPYLNFTPPYFASKVIGSHEFSLLAPTISLSGPGGSTFSCSYFDGSLWQTCTELMGSNVTWTVARATAGTKYRFRNFLAGQSVEVEFDPKKVYGEDFEVVNCGYIETTGSVPVNTLVGNPSPICLAANVEIDCGSTAGTLGIGTKVIGWSSKNSVTNSTVPSTCFSMNGANVNGTTTMLANLNMNLTAPTTGTVKGFSVMSLTTGTTAGHVVLKNSRITTDASSTGLTYGLSFQGNQPGVQLIIQNSQLSVDTTQTGVNNSIMLTADNQAPIKITNSMLDTTGASNYVKTAISFNPGGSSPGPIHIDRSSVFGTGLKVLGNPSGTLGIVSVTNSDLNVTALGASVFEMNGNIGGPHIFENNLIRYTGDQALFSVNGFGGSFELKLTNNKIVHQTSGQIISMSTSHSGTLPNFEFNRNSFLSTSTTSNGNSRVIYIGGTDSYNLNTVLPTTSGGNLVCATDAGTHGWSGSTIIAPAGGSLTTFPASATDGVVPVGNGCP